MTTATVLPMDTATQPYRHLLGSIGPERVERNDTAVRKMLALTALAQQIAPILYAAQRIAAGQEVLSYPSLPTLERLHFRSAAERAVLGVSLPASVELAKTRAVDRGMQVFARSLQDDGDAQPCAAHLVWLREAMREAIDDQPGQLNRSWARISADGGAA